MIIMKISGQSSTSYTNYASTDYVMTSPEVTSISDTSTIHETRGSDDITTGNFISTFSTASM